MRDDEMRSAVELAREWLASTDNSDSTENADCFARAVLAMTARLEKVELELSAHRSMAQIEPKEMSYQDRSEFTRLKHADVAQSKRVAELLGRLEQVEARKPPGFVVTCDHAALCDRGQLRAELNETQRDLCETTLEVDRLRGKVERAERAVEAAREVRETDKVWMAAGAPEYGELANAAATAHVRLEAALDAITALDAVVGEGEV